MYTCLSVTCNTPPPLSPLSLHDCFYICSVSMLSVCKSASIFFLRVCPPCCLFLSVICLTVCYGIRSPLCWVHGHVCLGWLTDFLHVCTPDIRADWPSACLLGCLSVWLAVCLSVSLRVCLPAYMPVCLSTLLSVCLSLYVFLPAYLSVCLSVWLKDIWLHPRRTSVCLPICLSGWQMFGSTLDGRLCA